MWAVSGHHYLTLQKEHCKQMLAAHSAAACLAEVAAAAAAAAAGDNREKSEVMQRSEAEEWGQTVAKICK